MIKDMYPLFFCFFFFWGWVHNTKHACQNDVSILTLTHAFNLLILFLTTQLSPILAEKKGKKFVIKTMLSYFRTISVV